MSATVRTASRRGVALVLALLLALTLTAAASPEVAEAAPPPGSVGYQSWAGNLGEGVERKFSKRYHPDGSTLQFQIIDCGATATDNTVVRVRLNQRPAGGTDKYATVRSRRMRCGQRWTLTDIEAFAWLPFNHGANYQWTVELESGTIRHRSLFARFQGWRGFFGWLARRY